MSGAVKQGMLEVVSEVIAPSFGILDRRLGGVESGLSEVKSKIDDVDRKLFRITDNIGMKVDKHEKRIGRLEVQLSVAG